MLEVKKLDATIPRREWLIDRLNTARIEARREDYEQYLEKWEREHPYTRPHPLVYELGPDTYEVFKYAYPRYDWDKVKEIFNQYRELED